MRNTAETRLERAGFWLATGVAITVLWWARLRFWFPHDEGTLAQAAVRVLAGEVPHRDFSHPYTGLDAVLHAGVLAGLGDSLAALRTAFAVVASGWMLGLALWFRQHLGSQCSAVAVLVLGAWGPAMYPAAMPSWYVTFLVTAAVALLTTRDGDPVPGAIGVAGALLGLAIGFKVTALYAIAGIGFWLMIGATDRPATKAHPVVLLLVILAAAAVWSVLAPSATSRVWVHIGVPVFAAIGWTGLRWLRSARNIGVGVQLSAMSTLAPLLLGVVIGVVPLIGTLVLTDSLVPFLTSLQNVTSARAGFADFPPPPVAALGWGATGIGLGWAVIAGKLRNAWVITALGALVFALAWRDWLWHRHVWHALRGALPLAVMLLMAADLVRRRDAPRLPVAIVALCWMTLSQFPFAAPVYFVYLAPIALMAAASFTLSSPTARHGAMLTGLGLALFGYLQVVPSSPAALGWNRESAVGIAPLPGPRGGLLVPVSEAEEYRLLLAILTSEVPIGAVWAGPDSPEVAYLAGRQDLNRNPFGFFTGADGPSEGDLNEVVAVVVRLDPAFTPPLSEVRMRQLDARFPYHRTTPHFQVYWGDEPCAEC